MRIELKLDIDGKFEEKEIIKRLAMLHKFLKARDFSIDKKKTRHGHHLRISFTTLRELDDRDIVFLQLFCGSDRNREMFNFLRVKSGSKYWNALFREKINSEGKLISQEV